MSNENRSLLCLDGMMGILVDMVVGILDQHQQSPMHVKGRLVLTASADSTVLSEWDHG